MAKAKKASVVVRLMSQAGTGYFYTIRRSLKGVQEKCATLHTCISYTARNVPTAPALAAGWSS